MKVINDKQKKCFYIGDDKIIASMTYSLSEDIIFIEHSWIDENHRGEGLGLVLIEEIARYARELNLRITPNCPYARKLFTSQIVLYGDVLLL